MYADIFAAIVPIFICAAIGYTWARSGTPYETEFVTRMVMNVGTPCLIIASLSKTSLPTQALLETLTAAALVLLATFILASLLCKLFGLAYSVYLGPLSFPNTVNMGLPVSLFAFGEEGLAVALGIYLVVGLAQFTFGIALITGVSQWRSSLRSPLIYAGFLGAAMALSDSHLPLWLENTLQLIGSLSIPLMLITLGVSLARLQVKNFSRSLLLSITRLLIGALVGVSVAELLELEGTVRGVVIIQSTMPSAVFNYLMAQRYGSSAESVAGIVVMSTLLSFATLPLLLWLLI
ncbi:MAG: putative permease [Oceanicoccus sp.]|jgi:predicted permease